MEISGCCMTSAAMLAEWQEQLTALKVHKRTRWHGRLLDKHNVAQRVRYVGEVREAVFGDTCISFEFEVYKQPNRAGGAAWWPVVEKFPLHNLYSPENEPSEDAYEMLQLLKAAVDKLPRRPRQYFEGRLAVLMREHGVGVQGSTCLEAVVSTMSRFPTEFLAATAAIGGFPDNMQFLNDFMAEAAEEESELRRAARQVTKCENRRRPDVPTERARKESKESEPEKQAEAEAERRADIARRELERERAVVEAAVQRANEEARERKRQAKRAGRAGRTPARVERGERVERAADAAGACRAGLDSSKEFSLKTARRREKRAKQLRVEQRRAQEKQAQADVEFRKLLQAVEPLREAPGTVVREEDLESVKEAALKQRRAKANPPRQRSHAEQELLESLFHRC